MIKRTAVIMMSVGLCTSIAGAAITAAGDVSPADPGTWTTSTNARIGLFGAGSVGVDDDSNLVSDCGYLGFNIGSTGAVTVSDAGTTWSNSSNLDVGYYGRGTLNIASGGAVTNTSGHIGAHSGSMGVATVSGAGSTWTNSDYLDVGSSGNGALNIANDGLVVVGKNTYVARHAGSAGVVNFEEGTLTTGVFLGNPSDLSGTGTINTNGLVSDVDLIFDATHDLTQTLILDGPGQNITVNLDADGSRSMGAGYSGNGSMHISDGRTVQSTDGYLGHQSGSNGIVTVSGIGSTWANSDNLHVGFSGDGALDITDGGAVSNTNCYIGAGLGSTGVVTISGNDSTWTNSADLHIGFNVGAYGALDITDGGTVSSVHSYIGRDAASEGVVTVSGAGSTWSNFFLYIGWLHSTSDGALYIADGGTVINPFAIIGLGATGAVAVNGAGSTWTAQKLIVGETGYGRLDITNGGVVSNHRGSIGSMPTSTGVVTVSGIGSTLTYSDYLRVGFSGDGSLLIDNGGLVSVGDELTIDFDLDGGSFINMGTGGMLALNGNTGDSLASFLGLIEGTDAIRYWDESIWDWAHITGATPGDDYTLDYLTEGDLAGYTMLTVTAPIPVPGDTNRDFIVDTSDYDNLIAQFGGPPGVESADFNDDNFVDLDDFAVMRDNFGFGVVAAPDAEFGVAVPEPAMLTLVALTGVILIRRGISNELRM